MPPGVLSQQTVASRKRRGAQAVRSCLTLMSDCSVLALAHDNSTLLV